MLSLNSAKAGSSDARGSEVLPDSGPEGVVCEARREVREGGRRGVVGRECVEGLRLWLCEGVAILTVCGGIWFRGCVYVRLYVIGMRRLGGGVVVFVDRLVFRLVSTKREQPRVKCLYSATLLHPTSLPKDHCEGC